MALISAAVALPVSHTLRLTRGRVVQILVVVSVERKQWSPTNVPCLADYY